MTAFLLAALLPATRGTCQTLPAGPMLDERMVAVEAEIGRLMQRRVDGTGAGDAARTPRELELRIDVRIVARWLLARAADAPPGGDVQVCAWIRAGDLLSAALLVERELDAGKLSPGPGAEKAIKALHDVTFKLPDGAKSALELDAVCRTAGMALVAASGGDASVARLPEMRPAPPITGERAASGGRATLEELAARSRELAVSPALRAQLLAVSRLTLEIDANDAKRTGELSVAHAVLDEAVRLAEGLQGNTAVEREDRARMEAQLAQGLAMVLDSRTRSLGQRRVAGLTRYGQMLTRLRGMKLAPDLQKKFAPALTWAQQNPAPGGELLAAIETFVQQDPRLAAAAAAPGAKDASLSALGVKALDETKRRAAEARESFVAGASSSAFFKKPDTLRARADAMRAALDARDAIAQTPGVVKAIAAFRGRPSGPLDKRVQAAFAVWTTDATDADRAVALRFLQQLARLAAFAGELTRSATAPSDASAAIRPYAGGSLDAFRARQKELLTVVVNAVAGGAPLDDSSFAALETARTLLATAESGARAERALAHAEVLRRWVDWGAGRDDLDELLTPYREIVAEAFEGFANDETYAVRTWTTVRPRYEAVLALLNRVADRADACAALPPGRTGALAKLLTPLADRPYAQERTARLAIEVWCRHKRNKDEKRADAALEVLAARLSQ